MSDAYIFQLRQPCKNRGVTLYKNNDGSVNIGGTRCETIKECEDLLKSIPRLD